MYKIVNVFRLFFEQHFSVLCEDFCVFRSAIYFYTTKRIQMIYFHVQK